MQLPTYASRRLTHGKTKVVKSRNIPNGTALLSLESLPKSRVSTSRKARPYMWKDASARASGRAREGRGVIRPRSSQIGGNCSARGAAGPHRLRGDPDP